MTAAEKRAKWPSRDPNVPHPGMVFDSGCWRSLEGAAARAIRSNARSTAWRAENPERSRAFSAAWKKANPEKCAVYSATFGRSLAGVAVRQRHNAKRAIARGNQILKEHGLLGD